VDEGGGEEPVGGEQVFHVVSHGASRVELPRLEGGREGGREGGVMKLSNVDGRGPSFT
jgi:hypothetical protein